MRWVEEKDTGHANCLSIYLVPNNLLHLTMMILSLHQAISSGSRTVVQTRASSAEGKRNDEVELEEAPFSVAFTSTRNFRPRGPALPLLVAVVGSTTRVCTGVKAPNSTKSSSTLL